MKKGKELEEQELDYNSEEAVEARLAEGRQELKESVGFMNDIKTKVSKYHVNTKDFFEQTTEHYKTKEEELEGKGEGSLSKTVKAVGHAITFMGKKEDPTKKRLGRQLNNLVEDARNIYGGLKSKIDLYDKHFGEVDQMTGNLISNSKTYRADMARHDGRKTKLETKLGKLENELATVEEAEGQGEAYLDLREKILNTKQELDKVTTKRTLALNKYKQALNLLDAFEVLRDEQQIVVAEGKNLYEGLKTNIDSLTPLFEQISSSADLVEFQEKALGAWDMLKSTFNPAMLAIAKVSKATGKVAAESMKQNFIEDRTIKGVKALTGQHKKERKERAKHDDEEIEGILNGKDKTRKKEVEEVTLEADEDGVFGAPEKTEAEEPVKEGSKEE